MEKRKQKKYRKLKGNLLVLAFLIVLALVVISVYALEEYVFPLQQNTYKDVYENNTHVFVPKFKVGVWGLEGESSPFEIELKVKAIDSPNFTIANTIEDYNGDIIISHNGIGTLTPTSFTDGFSNGRITITLSYTTTDPTEVFNIYINDSIDGNFSGNVSVDLQGDYGDEFWVGYCAGLGIACNEVPRHLQVSVSGIQDCDTSTMECWNGAMCSTGVDVGTMYNGNWVLEFAPDFWRGCGWIPQEQRNTQGEGCAFDLGGESCGSITAPSILTAYTSGFNFFSGYYYTDWTGRTYWNWDFCPPGQMSLVLNDGAIDSRQVTLASACIPADCDFFESLSGLTLHTFPVYGHDSSIYDNCFWPYPEGAEWTNLQPDWGYGGSATVSIPGLN